MIYKKLGNTDVKIPAIGQGTAAFRRHPENASKQIEALRLGVSLGMTLIDTAEQYGGGYSEEIVAGAIKGIRDKVFIATKISPENLSYNKVLKAAEESLQRLKIECVDLYQIHWSNLTIPIRETMRAMEKLVEDGKVRFIGVSNFSVSEIAKARKACNMEIVSVQAEYNLFDHTIEDNIIPYCKQAKMMVIGYSPLDYGRLSGGERELKMLQAIANKYDKTAAQITLNWLIRKSPVVVIPKASNPEHVKQNAIASDFTLEEKDIQMISQLFRNEFVYVEPYKIQLGIREKKDYKTLEEAKKNERGVFPSPVDLAQSIKSGETLKAIRITPISNNQYSLAEGGMRYWAHVIAYGKNAPIQALVRRAY